jgi:hypothetical protein
MIITAKEFGSYFIEVDNYNHTLKFATGRRNDKDIPITEIIGYYNSVENAVAKIIRLRMNELHTDNMLTMETYIKDLKTIKEELLKAEYNVQK